MLPRWRLLLTCGLLLWQAGQAWAGDAPPPSAQERLEQARMQLLEQAMRASTRVDALSWVDAQGRLQEHQSLRQSVELAPLAEPGSAHGHSARDLVREPPTDCRAQRTATDLRATLALRTHWPSNLGPAVYTRLQDSVQGHWLGEATQRPWRMFRSQQPPPDQSAYERLLLAPPAEHSPWRAELHLHTMPPLQANSTRMAWRLALMQNDRLLLDQRAELELPQRQQAWGAEEWTPQAWQAVDLLLDEWAQQLNRQFACVRPRAQVVAQEGGRWVLNMGSLAGLRMGDEWALVDPAWLPERTLEAGAIEHLVVARVVHLDSQRAELLMVAGNTPSARAGWIALPLNDPHAGLTAHLTPSSVRR